MQSTVYHYQEIDQVASKIAAVLEPNDVVGISGDLGAGKTTLVKSMAHFFGVPVDEVTSPTYVYHHIYKASIDVHHVDLYRIIDESMLLGLDLHSYMQAGGVFFVEWVDKFPQLFAPYLHLSLETVDAQTRRINVNADQWPASRRQALTKVFA